MITSHASLEMFQEFNWKIYQLNDDRHCSSVVDIISYLHRDITRILKAVRKEKHQELEKRICVTFRWAFAVASRLHINVAHEMWKRFPGCCPYCKGAVCDCKERADSRQALTAARDRPESLRDWQKMFAAIYPNNKLQDSVMHLAEEIGELSEAIRNFFAVHSDEAFNNIAEEIVDIFANLLGTANCLDFDVAALLADYYKDGCPKCQQCPCRCGYIVVDQPV